MYHQCHLISCKISNHQPNREVLFFIHYVFVGTEYKVLLVYRFVIQMYRLPLIRFFCWFPFFCFSFAKQKICENGINFHFCFFFYVSHFSYLKLSFSKQYETLYCVFIILQCKRDIQQLDIQELKKRFYCKLKPVQISYTLISIISVYK